MQVVPFPDPPILAFLLKKQGTPEKNEDYPLCRALKILGKGRKNAQKSKETRKTKQKNKEMIKARIGGSGLRTPRPATETRDCPTWNFHEKYRKHTPRPEILDSQNLPSNTPKTPKKYLQNAKNGPFGYFLAFLGVFSWGSRISVRGYLFWYFWWKFRVRPSRGSVAGRGVLNCISRIF